MTAPRATLVIGLPASGKSQQSIAYSQGDQDSIYDDCMWSALPQDRQLSGAIERLKTGRDCVLNDVAWCDPKERAHAVDRLNREVPGIVIAYSYRNNNPEACILNAARDYYRELDSGRLRPEHDARPPEAYMAERIQLIRHFSMVYEIPADAVIVPVFTGPLF